MTEPEDYDEDLFADLYEAEEAPAKPPQPSAPANDAGNLASAQATPADPAVKEHPTTSTAQHANGHNGGVNNQDTDMNGASWDDGNANDYGKMATDNDDNHGPVGIKEDGSETTHVLRLQASNIELRPSLRPTVKAMGWTYSEVGDSGSKESYWEVIALRSDNI